MAMAREAIEGHLELLAEAGEPIPEARSPTAHAGNPEYAGCTWALVEIDVTRYIGKAEKLNITLPCYLAARIDAYVKSHPEHRSRSGLLAEAALCGLSHEDLLPWRILLMGVQECTMTSRDCTPRKRGLLPFFIIREVLKKPFAVALAKAGTQVARVWWIPACAGMTTFSVIP